MESKWFVDENVKNIDKEILLCFPYAGASINMFSMWKEYIDKVIVCPVKLPFRDARRKEKLPESVQKLAEVFVKENIDIMRKRYSIFGHCTGAILGYEIARQTYEKTGNEPTVIIASSSQEPAIIPKEAILLAGASDSEIQAYLETERLVDKSILEMPEFQEYYFPILRADFRLFASYHASYHKFNCPIITIYDPFDSKLIKDDAQGWGKYTTKYEERYIEGGHYAALKNIQQITEKINQIIER